MVANIHFVGFNGAGNLEAHQPGHVTDSHALRVCKHIRGVVVNMNPPDAVSNYDRWLRSVPLRNHDNAA